MDNYILDLRRQLGEANNERITLLNVQRQQRGDISLALEAKDAAEAESEALRQELSFCKDELKVSKPKFPIHTLSFPGTAVFKGHCTSLLAECFSM